MRATFFFRPWAAFWLTTAACWMLVGVMALQLPSEEPLLQLCIGMEPENRESLEYALAEISNPTHRRYGRYLSRTEAKALLQPRRESAAAVRRWLMEAGVSNNHVLDDGQFMHVQVSSEQASTLLRGGQSLLARHEEGNRRVVEHAVPSHLRQHIISIRSAAVSKPFVGGTDAGKHRERQRRRREARLENIPEACISEDVADGKEEADKVDLEKCKSIITPTCLRKLYHMGNTYAKGRSQSIFGIAGFIGQAAQYDQLSQFLDLQAPYAAGANFSVEFINGGENPQGEYPSGEANLDIQYAIAMAYNTPVRFYSVGGEFHDIIPDLDLPDKNTFAVEPYLEFASHLLNLEDKKLPKVISISYGVNEQILPKAYARQVCDMFGQLGTRGVSIVVASGDLGTGSSCQSNDGHHKTKFLPTFPASCPYVTTVGSTASNSPELAANFSSGGFSDYFARPKWQQDAVGKYLRDHGNRWKGYYNVDGRAFPDVAVQGRNFQIMNHGKLDTADGTSASAPVFAAMITLLNSHRANSGRPAMGFLNPWIYRVGHLGFTDITGGRSEGCKGRSLVGLPSPIIPGAGWNAVPGWDPVTGWGTPLFDRLRSLSCSQKT